jgi:hypothetical protein
MKGINRFFIALVIMLLFLAWNSGIAQERQVNWEAFSKNLVKAIQTPNKGLQQDVLQKIIFYGDKLDVQDAVFDIVRIFRLEKNPQVRRLAMVALYKIGDDWAMYFLKRNKKFEKNKTILNHSSRIVQQYYAEKKAEKEPTLLANKEKE